MAESNRRAFLSGRSAADELEAAVGRLGDAILDDRGRRIPRVGDTIRLETRAMACVWQVMLPPGPSDRIMEVSHLLDAVHDLETAMTVYREDGELRQLNDNPSLDPVPVSEDLFDVLALGAKLTRATAGCFDVTSGPLVSLWREARGEERVPTDEEVAAALERCGVDSLVFDATAGTVTRSKPGMQLALGALGKGFALDRIAASIQSAGIGDFLIHGGHSSVLAYGACGTDDGWPIALRNPLLTEQTFGTVLLQNEGFSSSGSNVQFYRVGGKRYGHLLDPRTGWPAAATLSATVVSATAAAADALSTAFFVAGLDFARNWCDTARPEESTAADLSDPFATAGIVTPPPQSRTIEPVFLGDFASRFYRQDRTAATQPSL